MHTSLGLVISSSLLVGASTDTAEPPKPTRGIEGQMAPSWKVERWFNLPTDDASLDVADFRGKVVYLYAFQSWCPGCHSRGFPTLRELMKRFEADDDVAFVAVQTVFEGFHANTPQTALETARRYGLSIPVGHSGKAGAPSPLMHDYRTGGTPWTIIIDRTGVVRLNDFHVAPDSAEQLMRRLKNESTAAPTRIVTLPGARGGQDRIGARLEKLEWDRVLPRADDDGTAPRPRATLYRWWTDACPHCEATLPAIEALRRRYEIAGLRVVAAYHPKPPRRVTDDFVRATAAKLGYRGTIAIDEDWSVLREAYLRFAERSATSISLLVDGDGTIRFVHPGPVFFASTDPGHTRENDDHRLIEEAIRAMLDVPADRPGE